MRQENPNRHPTIAYRMPPQLFAVTKDQLRRLDRTLSEREVTALATEVSNRVREQGVRAVDVTLQHAPFEHEPGHAYVEVKVRDRAVFVRVKCKTPGL